jgi:hypothetical protein
MRSCLQSFLLKTDTAASVSGAGGVEEEEEEDKENLKLDISSESPRRCQSVACSKFALAIHGSRRYKAYFVANTLSSLSNSQQTSGLCGEV